MAEAACCWPLTTLAQVQSWATTCGTCCGRNGTGTDFSLSTKIFPIIIIPPVLHAHSLVYH